MNSERLKVIVALMALAVMLTIHFTGHRDWSFWLSCVIVAVFVVLR